VQRPDEPDPFVEHDVAARHAGNLPNDTSGVNRCVRVVPHGARPLRARIRSSARLRRNTREAAFSHLAPARGAERARVAQRVCPHGIASVRSGEAYTARWIVARTGVMAPGVLVDAFLTERPCRRAGGRRRAATRYEKRALHYLAMPAIAAALLWRCALRARPRRAAMVVGSAQPFGATQISAYTRRSARAPGCVHAPVRAGPTSCVYFHSAPDW